MGGPTVLNAGEVRGRFYGIQNNTHPQWWKDSCLRWNVLYCVGLCGMFYTQGYDGSLFNGLQSIPAWLSFFNPSANMLGLMNSAFNIPAIFTSFIGDRIAHKYGRRWAVWIACLLTLAGGLINALSVNMGMYIAGRAVMGAGTACGMTVAPSLLQEIAHPRYRAQIGSMYSAIFYVASIVSSWCCYGTQNLVGNKAWRIPCYLQIVGPIFTFVITLRCPESPRWLMKNGQREKAIQILQQQHANGSTDDPLVELEVHEIESALAEEEISAESKYRDFVRTSGNRHRLLLVLVVSAGTNFVGNGIISYYLTPILKLVGVTKPSQTAGINCGLQIWNLFLAVAGALSVELVGRRFLWLTSTIGMLFALCIATGTSAGFAKTQTASVGIATIPFLYLFFGFYDIAWTPLSYSYSVEILPYDLRTKGQAIFVVTQNLAGAVNGWVNPIALAAIGWKYYTVYITIDAVLVAIIWTSFPETKGLTIEEIGLIFDKQAGSTRAIEAFGVAEQGKEEKVTEHSIA